MLPTRNGYMNKAQANNGAGIAKQWFEGNNKFVIRGQFLNLLRDNTFSGFKNEDASEHMERIIKIAELYKTKNMTYNQFMLRVFPNTLVGEAMRWLNFETNKPITSWVELKIKFLEKFSQEFTCWLRSKFRYPVKMSPSLKNELWNYWRAGHDEEEIEDEGGELFRIETNLFNYETPLCKEFNEFNYLLKIYTDLFTGDLPGFKTFEAFKNTWLYEWNDQVPWVSNKPVYYDELVHSCEPIRFKDKTCEWPSCDCVRNTFLYRRIGHPEYCLAML